MINHKDVQIPFTILLLFFLSLLRIFISLNIFSFPEVEFFHKEAIQEMMLDLLFCFCKTYPELSYKQVLWLLLPVLRWFLEWLLVSVFHHQWIEGWGGGGGRSTSLRAVISKFTLKLRWKMQVFAWLEWGLMVSFCVKLDGFFVVMGIYNAAHTVPR